MFFLENLRFHKAEEHPEQDPSFAQKLSSLADFYVNDAFAAAHREHSSTFSLLKYFKGRSAAGFLLQKEVAALERIYSQTHPAHFTPSSGGAKISL
jgi:phosphoglycerate kinase